MRAWPEASKTFRARKDLLGTCAEKRPKLFWSHKRHNGTSTEVRDYLVLHFSINSMISLLSLSAATVFILSGAEKFCYRGSQNGDSQGCPRLPLILCHKSAQVHRGRLQVLPQPSLWGRRKNCLLGPSQEQPDPHGLIHSLSRETLFMLWHHILLCKSCT